MKILLSSYVFSPSVGGIETVSALIGPEFLRAGHEVILVTATQEQDYLEWPFPVYRAPARAQLVRLFQWCDVFLQSNISLRFGWPLLFVRRPWIIVHQTWLEPPDGRWNFRSALKYFLLRYASNVSISAAIAKALPVPSTIIGNPYSNTIFKLTNKGPRDRELVYLGRLVSDKGVDFPIKALVKLRESGLTPRLTIIGSGPAEATLRQLAADLGVDAQVEFTGSKAGEELAGMLNRHQVLVVPSTLPEPFGIVALEGIACGCVVVASRAGGLPDVVGSCGLTYQIDDLDALAETLHSILTQPILRDQLRENADRHLAKFCPPVIVGKYLQVLNQATAQR